MSVTKNKVVAGQPSRTGGSITFSISCQTVDKKRIDIRAKALGMDRSAYLVALARQDFVRQPDSDFVMITEERLLAKAGDNNDK